VDGSTINGPRVTTRRARLTWGIFALSMVLIAVDAAIFLYDVFVSGHQDPNYVVLCIEIPVVDVAFAVIGAYLQLLVHRGSGDFGHGILSTVAFLSVGESPDRLELGRETRLRGRIAVLVGVP
jgi:hypothetical protein